MNICTFIGHHYVIGQRTGLSAMRCLLGLYCQRCGNPISRLIGLRQVVKDPPTTETQGEPT